MSDKKQWRLPEIREKWERRDNGSDLNPNKQVHAGDVGDLLTSHMSKPVSYGCILPKIGDGQLMRKHTSKTMHTGSGKVVSTHFPPLPVKAVSQQQVSILNKRSSASSFGLGLQNSQQGKHDFKEFKLPVTPAVVKQDCGNKLKRDRLPTHLPPVQTMTQASSRSAEHKPEMSVLRPTTVQDNICKPSMIKNTPVKRSRPNSVNLNRLPVLPPIPGGTEELDRSFKLPPVANMQRAESPRKDKAKKKKKMTGIL